MRIRTFVKRTAEHVFGLEIRRKRDGLQTIEQKPFGIDVFHDIRERLPRQQFTIFCDVGAHRGETALRIKESFPTSHIYCYEPVRSNYDALVANTTEHGDIECFELGLGAAPRRVSIETGRESAMCRIVAEPGQTNKELATIALSTLDGEIEKLGIRKISCLKIDTEGYDMEVLRGSTNLLKEGRVEVLQVEAAMNFRNTYHVQVERFKEFLEGFGYMIFGVYEQQNEWIEHQPQLRRANVVFVSEFVVHNNTGAVMTPNCP